MSDLIGVFGLGLIGMAVSHRLISNGYQIIGHDPSSERMELLTTAGGVGVDGVEIWKRARTIIVAVFDTEQLAQLVAAAPSCPGTDIVVLSTCDPERMGDIGDAAKAKNIELVEAPLSGTSQQLANGAAVFLTGGNEQSVKHLTALFNVLGKAHHFVGELGNGNRTKLAINLILGLNRAALAEGLVFAERLGLEPAEFLALVQGSAASSAVMGTKGPLMVSGDFTPQGRISQSHKDFSLILDAANKVGQKLPFGETYLAMMEDCIAKGEEGLDNSAIISAISRAKTKTQSEDE